MDISSHTWDAEEQLNKDRTSGQGQGSVPQCRSGRGLWSSAAEMKFYIHDFNIKCFFFFFFKIPPELGRWLARLWKVSHCSCLSVHPSSIPVSCGGCHHAALQQHRGGARSHQPQPEPDGLVREERGGGKGRDRCPDPDLRGGRGGERHKPSRVHLFMKHLSLADVVLAFFSSLWPRSSSVTGSSAEPSGRTWNVKPRGSAWRRWQGPPGSWTPARSAASAPCPAPNYARWRWPSWSCSPTCCAGLLSSPRRCGQCGTTASPGTVSRLVPLLLRSFPHQNPPCHHHYQLKETRNVHMWAVKLQDRNQTLRRLHLDL